MAIKMNLINCACNRPAKFFCIESESFHCLIHRKRNDRSTLHNYISLRSISLNSDRDDMRILKNCANSEGKFNFSSLDMKEQFQAQQRRGLNNINEAKTLIETEYGLCTEPHCKPITCLAISKDSQLIVSGSEDRTVRVWSIEHMRQDAVLRNHKSTLNSVAITNNNDFVIACCNDPVIVVWNLQSKCIIAHLKGHSNHVTCSAINDHSNTLVSGSYDKSIMIWNLMKCIHYFNDDFPNKLTPGEFNSDRILRGHNKEIKYLIMSNDNRLLVSYSTDHYIIIWSYSSGLIMHTIESYASLPILNVGILHDNNFIVVTYGNGEGIIWDVRQSIHQKSIFKQNIIATVIDRSGDNIITISSHYYAQVYQYNQGIEITEVKIPDIENLKIARCVDTMRIVVANGPTIQVVDLNKNQVTTMPYKYYIVCLVFSPNMTHVVIGSSDHIIRIWNLQSNTLVSVKHGHTSAITAIAITSNTKYIFSGSENKQVLV